MCRSSFAPMTSHRDIAEPPVTLRLLGSIELWIGPVLTDTGRRQVRHTLAHLGAAGASGVRSDALIDALWPDQLPADPRASLRVVLSRVRAALGDRADALSVRGATTYLETVTDVQDFNALLRRADATSNVDERIQMLSAALDLWRGEPFGDIVDPSLAAIAVGLDEQRHGALEALGGALLEAGQASVAVDRLAPEAERRPDREGLTAITAEALAYTGQRSRALDLISRTRDGLRSSGLDISAVLADAESRILRQDVDLQLERPITQPTTAPTTFVGRTDELDKLRRATTPAVTLVGEPGIGKSTLMANIVAQPDRSRGPVIAVQVAQRPHVPMEPIAQIIEQLLDAEGVDQVAEEFHDAVDRLAPGRLPARSTTTVHTRESLVIDAAGFIAKWLTANKGVLAVDDCQWLDRGSSSVLELVVRHGTEGVLLSSRSSAPEHTRWLRTAGPLLSVIELEPLDVAEVDSLCEARGLTRRSDAMVARLHARAGGNPLFIDLLLALVEEGLSVDDELPASILVAVEQRVQSAPPATRAALEVASLIGPEFDGQLLDDLAVGARSAVDAAVDLGLVARTGTDEFVFTHALVRDGISQLMAVGHRIAIHDEIGHLLEAAGASAMEIAPHCLEASAFDRARAGHFASAAAGEAAASFAWDVCLDFIEQADALGDVEAAFGATNLYHRGVAYRALGRTGAEVALTSAARAAQAIGDDELFARSVIELCGNGQTTIAGTVASDALELLDTALAMDLPVSLRAEVCAAGSTLLSVSDQQHRGHLLFREARQLTLHSDHPTVEGRVLGHAHLGLSHPDDFSERKVVAERLAAIAGSDPDLLWEAAFISLGVGLVEADVPRVEREIAVLRAGADDVRVRPRSFGLAFSEVAVAVLRGDLEVARNGVAAVAQAGNAAYSASWVANATAAITVAIHEAEHRLGELLPVVDTMLGEMPNLVTWRAVAAAAAAELGDEARCAKSLAIVAADDFAHLVPDLSWTAVACVLAAPVALVGTEHQASTLYALLEPHRDRLAWNGLCTHQPTDAALSVLARRCGNHEDAERHETAAQIIRDRVSALSSS